MNAAILEQKETYREVNSVTGTARSVVFGTERLSALPFSELVQDFGLNISVCNRSVEGAVLKDAFELLDDCVFALKPVRVFLNFGETDLMRSDFSQPDFISDYARLIDSIRKGCRCRIFIVPVISESEEAAQLNEDLRALSSREGCSFVDVSDAFRYEKPCLRIFSEMVHYMREGRICFADAMNLCEA